MIAVDTNILVYAHRSESVWHAAAKRQVTDLAEGRAAWAIPWTCIHEFFGTVTGSRARPPTSATAAIEQIEAWLRSPSLVLLKEEPGYWLELRAIVEAGKITGARIHDARIAALCISNGVRELWTADRDFTRFPGLAARNPLVGG